MIGYRISRTEMQNRIEKVAPGWWTRANRRTALFRRMGKYEEAESIWSEVKGVYMQLQGGSKCAFCERKLESVDYGKGEQVVEHFRPKGNIRDWKTPAALLAQGIAVTRPPLKQGGYYLLAYDVFNYSAACNPCNSALKRDYFPVAGKHCLTGSSPRALLRERPLLIYPIGDFDDGPETLIQFHGVSPYAAVKSGHKRYRGLVTIEFFQLDDPSRNNLIRERAMILVSLFPALTTLAGPAAKAERSLAGKIVKGSTAAHSAHTNCARSFCRLFQTDPTEARRVYDRAADLVYSKS